MIRTSFAALCFAAFAGIASAADLTAVQTVQKVVETVDDTGATVEQLVEATAVAPGDTVVYALSYSNTGEEAAEGVKLTMPVPEQVILLEGYEKTLGTVVSYSADGGETFVAREDLMVGDSDAQNPATAEDITHMQWVFEAGIPAGEEGQVSFRGLLR
ncbi:MAG: hypothetical protein AAFQ22_05505 [Pseudomonadota bacterium]